jgi:hypothetical protein
MDRRGAIVRSEGEYSERKKQFLIAGVHIIMIHLFSALISYHVVTTCHPIKATTARRS